MYGSPRSDMTDREGLILQQTFFKIVISLSTVRWFVSLLSEQWWRECHHWSPRHASTRASCRWIAAGGRFQWSLSSENRRRSWARNLWEGRCWAKGQTPHWAKCTRNLAPKTSTWTRKRQKSKVQEEEVEVEDRERRGREQSEDRRENRQSLRRMTHGWDDAHKHMSHCGITHRYACALWTRKRWRVRCTVYTPRRLQQIAMRCKRTYYNKFLKNIYSIQLHQFLSKFHHEELEEEGCHLWYCWKGIGSARSSPDSRWRRFIIVTVVRKSDRSLIGAFLPLGPANFELRITIYWFS